MPESTTNHACAGMPPHAHRVLLVEDTVSIRKLLAEILKQADFDVVEAENGQDALAQLAGAKPDIILSDILMPVMDGREFLKCLRRKPACETVPVLMLSADFDADLEREFKALGAEKLMAKVGAHRQLISTIQEILRSK